MVATTSVSVPERNTAYYRSDLRPIWCAGCGDFGVLAAFYESLVAQDIDKDDLVIVSGIGCSSRIPGFIDAYGFHGVHGRSLPVATGIKIARPDLTVVAFGGDGDYFSIGGGHLPHAARRNLDLTAIVMDNQIYGLTKGQISPTSPQSMRTKTTPYGATDFPINPIGYALMYGATFVARAFSAQRQVMNRIFQRAMQHKGFSFVQVMSPCVTFHDTYKTYKDITQPMPESHDAANREEAMHLALTEEKLSLGVFYEGDPMEPPGDYIDTPILTAPRGDANDRLNAYLNKFA